MSDSEDDKWLAYELHDRLLPWIHGARMQLANLKVSSEDQTLLDIARHCLTMAAEEGRALIGFIESQASAALIDSLEMAVRKFVAVSLPLAQQGQQEIRITEGFRLGTGWTTRESWAILRIIQQAVQNAIQHAGPAVIELSGREESDKMIVEVRDSGRGFSTAQIPSGNHFGVSSMRERAEAIGAELEIQSGKDKGTIITLKVPCR